ncbi:GDSL-like protein [Acinetobacter baumannii UH7807]|nr:GDSL-like protein [Acinetobacter baumannii OIFC189]EJG29948.1 GDSL-like protein [Acinetobacter baumannii Naval-17]ETP77777.1 GDSL-like protein [Acinetobacter baumannii UH0707]ETP78006.1 GDSL-like protein [Acinetobacter baumannii UH0207]ETP78307.1 GDSL-like protein [Acinetobacter baumannii UH0807]ETQ61560.1 GDSL-like protein [Acinetobacter baumannii UH2707]ETQ75539.1 GDSL-like protein [Acinetobacter baumannii UH2907]ETQ86161.1 GDSL-like protein [Acinetobacter baumannii UH6107]ETQ89697.1 G
MSIRVETQMYKSYLFGSKSLLLISLSMLPMFVSAKTILILGDSISAGYGIDPKQGWVQLLQKRLDQQYPKQHKVVNASVSGETTSGALARLPKLLQTYKPEVVVIELGGNDGLRGQPPQMIQKNLSQLIQLSQKQKAKVILFGMKIPPNYGTAYSKAFENSYKTVSQKYQVKLLPFFLDGVAGQKQLMQNDLIHPNTQAQSKLLNLAYPYIKGAL